MKIFKVSVIAFMTLFIASFAFVKKAAIACELITLTHFSETKPNLYIDNSLSNVQQENLSNAIDKAVERVSHIYGFPISNPRIIATIDGQYEKFGFNRTGMQTSGFFRECIFLGPKGLNTDVIAHELVHAEIRHRTNLFAELTQLPAWFMEGTGVKVDYRKPFLPKNIKVKKEDIAKVKSIFYLKDFPHTNIRYYQASLIAVEPLNTKSLYENLKRLNNGEKFSDVFTVFYNQSVNNP